jgi:hypothetical protein
MRAPWLPLATALLASACASGERAPERPEAAPAPHAGARSEAAPEPAGAGQPPAGAEPAHGRPPPADPERAGFAAAASNDGSWRVLYRPLAGAIERGAPFAIEAWVLEPASGRGAEGVSLAADAAMPEHEHGMNREPRVVADAAAPGRFEVEGLLFHMAGRWELYLDVTQGALTERAQFEVMLE